MRIHPFRHAAVLLYVLLELCFHHDKKGIVAIVGFVAYEYVGMEVISTCTEIDSNVLSLFAWDRVYSAGIID